MKKIKRVHNNTDLKSKLMQARNFIAAGAFHYLPIIWYKFIKIILLLLNGIWAVPLVIFVRIIRPLILIKIGECTTSRIGHFIFDTLYLISSNEIKEKKEIILWAPQKISNRYWYYIIKKYIHINRAFSYLNFWNRQFPGLKNHIAVMNSTLSRDINGAFYHHLIRPELDMNDNYKAMLTLQEIGWAGEPYVCVLSRDSAYLIRDKIHGKNSKYKMHDYAYHHYRDSKIGTFKKSIEYLLNQGFWVFRMGNETEEELVINHQNFLDYSKSTIKNDFMDIYLFSNCVGSISTATGIDVLPQAYGIPSLIVNGLPLAGAGTHYNQIWVPKNLYWKKIQKKLDIDEYIQAFFFNSDEYNKNGINIVDLDEEEILAATQELVHRILGTEKISVEDSSNQYYFLNKLKKWKFYDTHHSFIHPKFKIGKLWLNESINLSNSYK